MTGAGMTYEEFGLAFVQEAVTPGRIAAAIREVAGREVEVGPLQAGPGGVAEAVATGTVGEPVVEQVADAPLGYRAVLPVDLDLDVNVGGTHHRYTAAATVRIAIAVRLEQPLSICIEPTPPTRREVSVKVSAKGLQAKMIGRIGDIDNELRREIASYVTSRIDSDATRFANVDLRPIMLAAWPV